MRTHTHVSASIDVSCLQNDHDPTAIPASSVFDQEPAQVDEAQGPIIEYIPEQLRQLESDLLADLGLAERVLETLPPVTARARVVRCTAENLEQAIARAFARAIVRGECWGVEVLR